MLFIAETWRRWRLEQVIEIVLIAVAVGWCVMRFVGLESVPFGLSTDETLSGMHVECLAQTGKSADGQPWPLFATGLGGGLYSPTYLYTLFAWTRVFGISISSIRGLSAAFSILAILGLGMLVRLLAGNRAALLAMVAGALSPWSFAVSRLAVDAPLTPALVVWGTYLFLRSPRWPWAAAGAVVLTLAGYTYSPVRVQVALLALLLLFVERKRLSAKRVLAFLGTPLIVGFPLAQRILDGSLLGRARALSILTDDYIRDHRGHYSGPVFVVKQTLENLFEHLRPSYLLFTGDANIRHSTQIMGELGWLDILAVGLFWVALGTLVWKAYRPPAGDWVPPSPRWPVAVAAVLVAAFGTLPAALCWEGLPHALRSMAAWPAVSVFTGVTLAVLWSRSRLVPVIALVLALAQTARFVPFYFDVYPKESYSAWSGELRAAAETRDPVKYAAVARNHPELGIGYYMLLDFGLTCAEAQKRANRIASGR